MSQVFLEKRITPNKPKVFNEKRSDMVIISKTNQKDLYLWCVTVATSFAIILVFLTIAIMQSN